MAEATFWLKVCVSESSRLWFTCVAAGVEALIGAGGVGAREEVGALLNVPAKELGPVADGPVDTIEVDPLVDGRAAAGITGYRVDHSTE